MVKYIFEQYPVPAINGNTSIFVDRHYVENTNNIICYYNIN